MHKLGKGMFGSVVKATKINQSCTQNENNKIPSGKEDVEEVYAIKIIRLNEMMQQSGEREYEILSKIHSKKSQTHSIMKLYDYFFEKGHLCLVC